MAIYRIFPSKDTTIWSEPDIQGRYGNAGKDEVVELGNYRDVNATNRIKRALIDFKQSEVNNVINNRVVTGSYTAHLHYSLANAAGIEKPFRISAHRLNNEWDEGIGKKDDQPFNVNDCTWVNRQTAVTWSNAGGHYSNDVTSSKVFTPDDNLDIHLDVTNIVTDTNNAGIILKIDDDLETNTTSSYDLRYFGKDTNTIFPPYLEFGWDDQAYSTKLPEIYTSTVDINFHSQQTEYSERDQVRFRLNVRPRYPKRSFVTSSVYLDQYRLPADATYSIVDDYSNEPIVDFNSNYTKVSADHRSSYIDINMNSFQPNRYYRLIVKATIDGSTVMVDQKNTFKVVR